MEIKSLGYRTDLIFHAYDGEILDREDHLLIRTPTNPDFYWGNFLLFSHPPRERDFNNWRKLFEIEIGIPPEIKHQVFGWDSVEGEVGVVEPFLHAGFNLTQDIVMTSSSPTIPSRFSNLVSIRVLKSQTDWEQVLENQVVCREPIFEETEYRKFREQQMDRYRKMTADGLGNWFGAFINEQLVADLGLYQENGIGRFQSVETHPDFRRRGIAGTLVYEASHQAIKKFDLQKLVIVAEQNSNAERLYQSLEFRQTEIQVGLEWWA